MKRLTLEEIGKMAGVSRATVSRVIHDHPNIRPEVRARVQKVIAETGYQPNLAARTLASNKSNIIGLLIPSVVASIFTDPYYPTIIQGISRGCTLNDHTLSLFLFHSREEEERSFQRILGAGMVDGLIVTADRRDQLFTNSLLEQDFPFVQIGRPENMDAGISYVDVDNVQGGWLATRHLIDSGFKRIAHISSETNTAGSDRTAGYMRALEESNVKYLPELVGFGDYTQESSYRSMRRLLNKSPDAVFVSSDAMALGALRAIREANLRVPEDIALVSFDDLPPSTVAEPPLTTVRQPVIQTGIRAVELLLDVMRDGNQRHAILPVELVVRSSSMHH